jgi:hypothetical protein
MSTNEQQTRLPQLTTKRTFFFLMCYTFLNKGSRCPNDEKAKLLGLQKYNILYTARLLLPADREHTLCAFLHCSTKRAGAAAAGRDTHPTTNFVTETTPTLIAHPQGRKAPSRLHAVVSLPTPQQNRPWRLKWRRPLPHIRYQSISDLLCILGVPRQFFPQGSILQAGAHQDSDNAQCASTQR